VSCEPTSVPERSRRRGRWAVAAVAGIGLVFVAIGVGPPAHWRWLQNGLYGPDAYSMSCCLPQRSPVRTPTRTVVRATNDDGPTGFSASDFAHSADARSGTATVTVTGNGSDSADALVSIRYADGSRDSQDIHLANPKTSHSWRFWGIGTYPSDPNSPPTAAP
jgi:hypothetical protein